ncbi:eukaryotic translation initiation factor 4E class II [Laetiporus sulphureus 93-53]|uniref:Eukaryotic translation initiation factor 4E class II n=1 Tax=Laetiporus sulphureus 93-53 TaxID=1314785 RepID=A0A165G5Q4_9APHY|nr:eukaryotic translation initiation factor 4E class II [Laetiporus sulphureus 93-53]KZT09862.1 eukaryotic translation initiation factor 4E class II [Laetiporus sulphureus 93-53]
MAGYFSNHSQSRFLANSNANSTTTTQQPVAPNPPSTATRPRAPSSKHFSTSVPSTSGDEKSLSRDRTATNGSPKGGLVVHPLRHTWVFWFRQQRGPGTRTINYEEGIKKVSAFGSVESFWSLWTHLNPPSSLLPTTDYLLFHSGIRRPVWEDPLNIGGGKWIIRLRKGVADRIWEDLILAIVGDQFSDCAASGDASPTDGTQGGVKEKEKTEENGAAANADTPPGDWPEICGCTISVRQNEDIISVWNKSDADARVKEKVKETIKRALNLPASIVMEYKSNNDSMQDKSSFRVPASVDRTPLS